jgi:hypothetical protein
MSLSLHMQMEGGPFSNFFLNLIPISRKIPQIQRFYIIATNFKLYKKFSKLLYSMSVKQIEKNYMTFYLIREYPFILLINLLTQTFLQNSSRYSCQNISDSLEGRRKVNAIIIDISKV